MPETDKVAQLAGQADKGKHEPIYVTRTFLPPKEEYLHWLNKANSSHHLTNLGPIHRELKERQRVFQHLMPVQRECVQEALRIARRVVMLCLTPTTISIPTWPAPAYRTREWWNFAMVHHSNVFVPTAMGNLYYYDTTSPSRLDIEAVMAPAMEGVYRCSQVPGTKPGSRQGCLPS